jgi:hypothetical protein
MKLTKQDGPLFGLILAMACVIGALFSCIVFVGMPSSGVDGMMQPSAKREIPVSVEKHHRHHDHHHHHD